MKRDHPLSHSNLLLMRWPVFCRAGMICQKVRPHLASLQLRSLVSSFVLVWPLVAGQPLVEPLFLDSPVPSLVLSFGLKPLLPAWGFALRRTLRSSLPRQLHPSTVGDKLSEHNSELHRQKLLPTATNCPTTIRDDSGEGSRLCQLPPDHDT
jgi:hypothetical protein